MADTIGSPPAAAGMVVYEDVSKFFPVRLRPGQKDRPELMVALDRVNATVRKGELVTLLGPSGCGKTTLLRLTAGLIAADEGRITIEGAPVTGPRKDACMVFQNFGLLPWRTVLGNVEFPLEIDGVGADERRDLAGHFIDLVGLGAFAEHYPHELSGGMQQRVGIARALMRKPILIFMDEPFGALDAQTREQLQEDFLKIWSQTGATVVFVTHSIDEALLLSDRIFVFSTAPGRIRTVVELPMAARATRPRRAHASRFRQIPRRAARNAQERGMNPITTTPRKSVPAPKVTLAQRLREVVLSPNAIRTLSVAVFFAIWEYYGRRMDPIFMAPPSAIFRAAVELTQSGALRKALVQTLWPFSVGMVLTVVIGILLGIVIAQWRTMEYILDPFINALYAIPRIALVPLIILWAGLEFVGKVSILVSVAIFPITVNTYAGIRDVRGSMLEIGRAYGATEWQIFSKIIMPAAIPFIMAGVRLGGRSRHHRHHRGRVLHRHQRARRHDRRIRQRVRDRQAVRADHRDCDRRRRAHRAGDVAGAADVALAAARAGAVLTIVGAARVTVSVWSISRCSGSPGQGSSVAPHRTPSAHASALARARP